MHIQLSRAAFEALQESGCSFITTKRGHIEVKVGSLETCIRKSTLCSAIVKRILSLWYECWDLGMQKTSTHMDAVLVHYGNSKTISASVILLYGGPDGMERPPSFLLHRTISNTFYYHLEAALFDSTGVGTPPALSTIPYVVSWKSCDINPWIFIQGFILIYLFIEICYL